MSGTWLSKLPMISVLTAVLVAPASGQQPLPPSSDVVSSVRMSAEDPEAGFVQYVSHRNANRDLPELEYWGVGLAQWGMEAGSFSTSDSGRQFGLFYVQHYAIESRAGLTAIRREFVNETNLREPTGRSSDNPEENAEALRQMKMAWYRKIRTQLEAVYGAPNVLRADLDVLGTKGFSDAPKTQLSSSDLEWQGPETTVALRFTRNQLLLEFRRSDTSKSEIKRAVLLRQETSAGPDGDLP